MTWPPDSRFRPARSTRHGNGCSAKRRRQSALCIDLGCSDLEWARGRAWAFEQAIGLVWYYQESNPEMSATGRRTLDRLLASA